MNTIRVVETLWQDLRFGVRLLLKNPAFAVVAVTTLALGTGANAAIFQLVNAVRLRSLPVERPGELVSVGIDMHGKGRVGRGVRGRSIFTEPIWQALRREQQAFVSMAAWGTDRWDLSTEGEARFAQGLYVSGGYFDTLGIRPHIGRLISEQDDVKGCGAPGAVLSFGFWQTRYGGNPGVLAQRISLDRQPLDIIGVAPPGFFGVEVGRTFDVAVPMCIEPAIRGQRDSGIDRPDFWWLDVIARLNTGWTPESAGAHLAAISPGIFDATVSPRYNAEAAQQYKTFVLTAAPAATGVSNLRRAYAAELWVLLGATSVVLLTACANLANLMLARASSRDREIAVRLAIGASRRRVVRQMLSEGLLIAALGAALGLLLARWLSAALVSFLSTPDDRLFMDLSPDWRVYAFITGVAILACTLFGLTPALKATGTNPGVAMQGGGRSHADGREAFALRRLLVVVQVALSTVLVIGALLFGRSLIKLVSVDPGFRQDGIMAMDVDVRRAAVNPEALQQTTADIMARVRAVPGVSSASEMMILPIGGSEWNGRIVVGGTVREGMVYYNLVGGEFFKTMEMPLLAGRRFDEQDRAGAPLAAVVNETFAHRYFEGRSPIGLTFQMEAPPGTPRPEYHVIGLVKDSKYADLREQAKPIAFLAWRQETYPMPVITLAVRSELPLTSITPALAKAALQAAPGAAVTFDTLATRVRNSMVTERLMASLSGFFGILALLIATVGLYGVISYMVTRRKVEIGIRMALGADQGKVVKMIIGESGVLLAMGVAAGMALALLATRWAGALLFGLQPWDPLSFAIATGTLVTVALLAAWVPARRASRLAPTVALRD